MNEIPIKANQGRSGVFRPDSSAKPSGSARSNKDFKKILEKDENPDQNTEVSEKDEEAENELDDEIALLEQTATAQQTKSIFELSQGKGLTKDLSAEKTPTPAISDPLGGPEEEPVSPNKLFGNLSKKTAKPFTTAENVPQPKQKEILPEAKITENVLSQSMPKSDLSKKDNYNTQFSTREEPDLAYVNPLSIPTSENIALNASAAKTEVPFPKTDLQALVDQLAKELSVMKTDGKTETTIELKNPPILDGARIVVTSFDSAKGDLNIKFENLTQAAQQILDQQQNRADLLSNLERKGYNVHILTTTTYDEPRIVIADAAPSRDRERERREDRGEGGGRRQRDEEEK